MTQIEVYMVFIRANQRLISARISVLFSKAWLH